jgi:hypothetical protein
VRPSFSFEVTGSITTGLRDDFERRIIGRVRAINSDFRTAMEEDERSVRPLIQLFPIGGGPFAADTSRIKQTRIVRAPDRDR